ncbi:MAG: hypothetical protein K2X52_19240 [Mycobacteriaceae bacterium]|nr:hypothetical protein [Mycobacteriaceae bacterium]
MQPPTIPTKKFIHLPPEPLIERRNASELMDYFTGIAMLILVLSPVLLPLVITGFHTLGTWRQKSASSVLGHRTPGPA